MPKLRRSGEIGLRKITSRGILEWILNAKRPDTRQKRIAETVELAQKKSNIFNNGRV